MVEHTEFWSSPVGPSNERPRPLESAQCSLCGIELPKGLMMPDGGRACADIRWYCKDSRSCTERWTALMRSDDPGEGWVQVPTALEGAPAEAQESQRAGGV